MNLLRPTTFDISDLIIDGCFLLFAFQITGTLPSDVRRLCPLQALWLDGLSLSGPMPSELGLLPGLKFLIVMNTDMSGSLPEELYSSSSLVHLDLTDCQFSGTISTSLGLLTDLETLQISNNQFSGTLPEDMGKLAKLRRVILNGNNFTAASSVPQGLCALRPASEFRGVYLQWEVSADCTPDPTTGVAFMTCPRACCTQCCDRDTGVCRAPLD